MDKNQQLQNNRITLIKPNISYKKDLLEYKQQFIKNNKRISGGNCIGEYEDIIQWLTYLKNQEQAKLPDIAMTTFMAIHKQTNTLIGMITIRHHLNEYLYYVDGNIGYSVSFNYRNQGYAKEILSLVIDYCRSIHMKELLITCNEENIASSKVIEANGGKLINIIPELYKEYQNIKRYFIEII